MKTESILTELKKLSKNNEIKKSELMVILKKYARIISVQDLMLATSRMRKDGEYVHANYREKYLSIYIKYFIMRMKEVKEKEDYTDSAIDKQAFDTSFPMLERTFEKERLSKDEMINFLLFMLLQHYTQHSFCRNRFILWEVNSPEVYLLKKRTVSFSVL